MEYPIKVYQVETTEGFEWVAEFIDVPGCVGGGNTKIEAITEAEENLQFHLEGLRELGLPIPSASNVAEEKYSGKLSLRIGKELHRKITYAAENDDVSINQFIVETLSEKVGMCTFVDVFKNTIQDVIKESMNVGFTRFNQSVYKNFIELQSYEFDSVKEKKYSTSAFKVTGNEGKFKYGC